jgi:dethiobiotin synthetase
MERAGDNIAMLAARLPAPCWGRLPFDPAADAAASARLLRIQFPG